MNNVVSRIKGIVKRILFGNAQKTKAPTLNEYSNLEQKSLIEIYAALRHETHRIEKAFYNQLLESKKDIYDEKLRKVKEIQKLIISLDTSASNNPVFQWSLKISESYPDIENKFVTKYSKEPTKINLSQGSMLLQTYKKRRSCRLWDGDLDDQTTKDLLQNLVEAAKWAPNSGNRQAVRLRPITLEREKNLLIGLKEKHCYTAPLLLYVGIDQRLYGALSSFEECMYLDAAAAITQMTIYLESVGLGVSWNHFGLDMIESRESNLEKYNIFKHNLQIPNYIIPVAILAIGKPAIVTPVPERMPDYYFWL